MMNSSHCYPTLVWLLVLIAMGKVCSVNGDYVVEVRTHSYSNPTNGCVGCGRSQTCKCASQCHIGTRLSQCSTYFFYCLREIENTERFSCDIQNGQVSSVNLNGAAIDFSQDEVLGLPNPLPLKGISDTWNGIQLFITTRDYTRSLGPDSLIDWFLINIEFTSLEIGVESNPVTIEGIFGFATIELSLRVVCATNYYGPDCSDFCDLPTGNCTHCPVGFTGEQCSVNIDDCVGATCSHRGVCVDGVHSYQCICNSGFTGAQCETNINDCAEVTCSGNGRCEDGVNTFTCICISGFNGQLCETNIDDCIGVNCSGNGQCEDGVDSFTCVCDPGFTGDLCKDTIEGKTTVTVTMTTFREVVSGSSNTALTVTVITAAVGTIAGVVILMVVSICVLGPKVSSVRPENHNGQITQMNLNTHGNHEIELTINRSQTRPQTASFEAETMPQCHTEDNIYV